MRYTKFTSWSADVLWLVTGQFVDDQPRVKIFGKRFAQSALKLIKQ